MDTVNWIAAETNNHRTRVWLMRDAEVVEQKTLKPEAGGLEQGVPGWPELQIIVADMDGMFTVAAGNCILFEAPKTPASATLRMISEPGSPTFKVGGITQDDPKLRIFGQTAIIAGILAAEPHFDGTICFPGRTSYWVRVSANEICHFYAYPTGKLLDEYVQYLPETPAEEIFLTALADGISRPQRAYGRLLTCADRTDKVALQIAGLLLGAEMADAKTYWLGEKVIVAGAEPLAGLYVIALKSQAAEVIPADMDTALLAGLYRGWQSVRRQSA